MDACPRQSALAWMDSPMLPKVWERRSHLDLLALQTTWADALGLKEQAASINHPQSVLQATEMGDTLCPADDGRPTAGFHTSLGPWVRVHIRALSRPCEECISAIWPSIRHIHLAKSLLLGPVLGLYVLGHA